MNHFTPQTGEDERQKMRTGGIIRWRCPNCGQTLFTALDDTPPDVCHYCKDMTTWQFVEEQAKPMSD